MNDILNLILQIPTRNESIGGQNYKYIRLEEVIYVANEADSKLSALQEKNNEMIEALEDAANAVYMGHEGDALLTIKEALDKVKGERK